MAIKKKIIIICITMSLVLLVFLLFITINNNITCKKTENNVKIKYNILIKNNNILFNSTYLANYKTMDDLVDNYDTKKDYLDEISKLEKVKTSITKNDKKLTYTINVELNNLDSKTIQILDLKEIQKFTKLKEFKKYYESLDYKCE